MNKPLLPSAVNLARLARDLAQDIFEPDQIRTAHQLTPDQFDKILNDEQFQRMLRDMVMEWNSAASTPERVRMKAASAVEVALESFFTDVVDKTIPLVQRTEALKALMKLGELGEKDLLRAGGGGGGGVQININLGVPGQGQPPKTITINAEPVEDEGSPALLPG